MKISHLLLGWSLFCAFFDPFQQFAKSKNLLKPQQKDIPSTRSLHYLFRVQQKLVPGQLNDSRELVEKRCKFWAENEITIKARFNWWSRFIWFLIIFLMEASVDFPYTCGWCRTVLGVWPPPALTCGGSKAPPVRGSFWESDKKCDTAHTFIFGCSYYVEGPLAVHGQSLSHRGGMCQEGVPGRTLLAQFQPDAQPRPVQTISVSGFPKLLLINP